MPRPRPVPACWVALYWSDNLRYEAALTRHQPSRPPPAVSRRLAITALKSGKVITAIRHLTQGLRTVNLRHAISYEWQTAAEIQSALVRLGGPYLPEIAILKAARAFPDAIIQGHRIRLQATPE